MEPVVCPVTDRQPVFVGGIVQMESSVPDPEKRLRYIWRLAFAGRSVGLSKTEKEVWENVRTIYRMEVCRRHGRNQDDISVSVDRIAFRPLIPGDNPHWYYGIGKA